MDIGKKDRAHTATADWTGTFAWGTFDCSLSWALKFSGHRYHFRVKVLKGEGSNSTSFILQGKFKISNYFFVVVRKVRSEQTSQGKVKWGGEEIISEDQRIQVTNNNSGLYLPTLFTRSTSHP